jgi:hypothetical protein
MANRSRHSRRSADPAPRATSARVPHRRAPRTPDEPRPAVSYAAPDEGASRLERKRAAMRRMRQRRRRTAVLTLLLAAAGLVGLDLARDRPRPAGESLNTAATTPIDSPGAARSATRAPAAAIVPGPSDRPTSGPSAAPPAPSGTPTPEVTPAPAATATLPAAVPANGTNAFSYSVGTGPVLGTAGPVRRFRVAVEDGMGLDPAGFAAAAERVLGDPHSWIAAGELRFQRVPKSAEADFTLYLATPGTSEQMCAVGGLDTDGYTSCRLPGQVIINARRWTEAVPNYGAPLGDYQAYAVNHEVGHQLGYGHEDCPAPGAPAPVMEQQTLGLRGCVANSWPYVDGQRYTGPAVP